MRILNKKGFAVTSILYSLATIICLVLLLIVSTMAGMKKNNDDLVDSIKGQLTNNNQSIAVNGIKIPLKKAYGATWARVFHHNNQKGTVLFTSGEVGHTNSEYKQSVLADMNGLKSKDGKFEFLLEYPEVQGYNRWKQTDNPYNLVVADGNPTAVVPGYEAIQISWGGNYWGGLAKSTATTATYIDGSVGASDWWYSMGTYITYGTAPSVGMPGPNSIVVSSTQDLWVRVDDYLGISTGTPTPPPTGTTVALNFNQETDIANYFTKELQGSGVTQTVINTAGGFATFTAPKENFMPKMQLNTVATGLKKVDFTLGVWPGSSTAGYTNYKFYLHNFQVLLGDGSYLQYYFTHKVETPAGGTDFSSQLPAPQYMDNFVVYNSIDRTYTNLGNAIPTTQYTDFTITQDLVGNIVMTSNKGHSSTINVGAKKMVSIKFDILNQKWGNSSTGRIQHFIYSY